ncbi:MAG: glycosyltransferase family 4 protein [Bacteroidales bacterium]|nr:glycosyltransferase family 4 protein [Bacteroidales bacterium]
MKIIVNTRLLIKNKLEGIGWVTYETLKRITREHPEHEFYFLFDRQFSDEFIFANNITPIIIPPQSRHPFLWYIWFEYSLPKIIRKIKPDLFFSPDGYLSLSAQVPSIPMLHDINFVHFPQDIPYLTRKFYNYYFPKYAQKAKKIITVSNYSKKDICEQFLINENKVDVVYNGANEAYKPISNEEKVKVKETFTEGNDFFIFIGALNPRKNVVRLLLAYDEFRKKINSNIKMVIIGEKMFKTKNIELTYSKLKYKNDIIFTGRLSPKELNKLLNASLALTFVPYFEGFGIPIVEAFYCDTPVITSNVTSMPEVAGDAALLTNPFSVKDISEAMIKIASNKELRQSLIEKGRIQREKFSWDKTAMEIWKSIEKAV